MSEEGPQMREALRSAERGSIKESDWFSKDGIPLIKISCAASELIATQKFSNVTVGPVAVSRFIEDGDDEHLAVEIRRTQSLCEAAVAEERQTIQALLRANVAAAGE